jgi:predicted nucleotidyltransferase
MRGIAAPAELETIIETLVERLRREIRVEAVVLFGSYVKGKPDEWSDIDVAVISPDFEGVRMSRRQDTLARLMAGTDPRVEALGHSSSEYRDPPPASFLREILRTGKVVYEADSVSEG